MLDTLFTRRPTPATPSEYGYLRVWLKTSAEVPSPPYAGALPASREQALLLLSLSCRAGIRSAELACMRVDALLNADGSPGDSVRIRAETTKNRVSRKVPMHPDISCDVNVFRACHPDEQWVAFIQREGGEPNQQQMSPHGLGLWLQSVFHNANLKGLSASSGPRMFRDTERRS